MKILFVTSLYPSNEEPQYCIFLEQQVEALRGIGHEVDVLKVHSRHIKEENLLYSGYRKGIKIFEWVRSKQKLQDMLVVPLRSERLTSFLETEKYDAVSIHFLDIRTALTVVDVCNKLNQVVVGHYHGLNVWNDYSESKKQKIVSIYRRRYKARYMKALDAVIGVSELTCKSIKKYYNGSNVYTVYNGVDTELFSSDKRQGASNDEFTVLCVANLIPIKGQRYLIRAIKECIEEGYSVKLRLVGVGSDKEILEQKCVEYGIENKVSFMGKLSYENVAKEMAKADMFVMPSYYEAFGCVYVEAMSSGTLTCGCRNNGAEEIITHMKDGLLVGEKSSQDISRAIIFAIESPETAKEIAMQGRNRAKELNWQNSAMQLERLYMNLQSRKHGNRRC